MSSKIFIQDLAASLSKKRNESSDQTTRFVEEFFNLISTKVIDDKSVKIKGLGTFKLIDVSDRESVNVNTGERILIPGHSKISFTPDATLRDQVNKPFADFQTVVLSDSTDVEEMERIDGDFKDEFLATRDPDEIDDSEDTANEVIPDETVKNEMAEAPVVEQPKVASSAFVSESTALPNAAPAAATPSVQIVRQGHSPWFTLAYILLTLALMALSYLAGCHKLLSSSQDDKADKIVQPVPAEAPALSPADSAALARKKIMEEAARYPQVEGGTHLIVGTKRVHTLQAGEGLIRLAQNEYGDKEFVQYILAFNEFPNPNVIPRGTEVKLPMLVEKP